MKRICLITTVSQTVDQFLRFTFDAYRRAGFDVSVICDMNNEFLKTLPGYVHAYPISMKRGISLAGIGACWRMFRIFRRERFDIVQYSTPNASFYASLASFAARIPVRLYCQWGMIFVAFTGFKRTCFQFIESMVCRLSTIIEPDSHGNLQYCRKLGLYDITKSRVVWNGSANGVNLEKFDCGKKTEFRRDVRRQYGISSSEIVLGFIGRLNRDKGFNELIEMYMRLKQCYPKIKMLYVGPEESTSGIKPENLTYFRQQQDIVKTGKVVDAERYLAAMDIFVFPSYREGFGSVVIEAQAMGCPVVITDIPGPTNGMLPDLTGLVVPVKDSRALYEAVSSLIEDNMLREQMGLRGIQFVREHFDDRILIDKIIEDRLQLLTD